MKAEISRTSECYGTEAPCEGAIETTLGEGRLSDRVWVIEITTLEELLSLGFQLGEPLIVSGSRHNEIGFCIEIYDTYRE